MRIVLEAVIAILAVQIVAILATKLLGKEDGVWRRNLSYLVSVAIGVLLGTAIFHLLPEAFATLGHGRKVWGVFAGTMFVLYGTERLFTLITGEPAEQPVPVQTPAKPPCDEPPCEKPRHQHHHDHHVTRPLSLVFGGMLHSLVDGASVAAAFSVNPRIGWITAFAISLHEVPHRVGDFALLLHLGLSPRRATRLVVLIALPALVGTAAVLILGEASLTAAHWLLPVSAASFLYIALVNLLPEIQTERNWRTAALQIAGMAAGAGLVALLARIPGA